MYFFVKIRHTQSSIKQIFRNIFTDDIKYNISKQSKFINKFINKSKSNRNALIQDIINPSYGASTNSKLSVHTKRRMNVLNKIFMEYITDMMSTGEIEPEILDRNIEISHVQITADFKLVNVYWIDNNFEKSEKSDTVELLKKCALRLRHELTQLRVIGLVPPIQFVKHKSIHLLKEVEQKLKTLDFGEGHVSSPYPNSIHHIVTSADTNQDVPNNKKDSFSVNIPIMKHNVFELDHFKIMSKIKVLLSKSKKIEKKERMNSLSESNVKDIKNLFSDDKQLFTQFLNQRKKEQKRKTKDRHKVDDPTYNYETGNNDYDNIEINQNNFINSDDDYFDDFEEFNRKQ